MKKTELIKIIKEEIQRVLNEENYLNSALVDIKRILESHNVPEISINTILSIAKKIDHVASIEGYQEGQGSMKSGHYLRESVSEYEAYMLNGWEDSITQKLQEHIPKELLDSLIVYIDELLTIKGKSSFAKGAAASNNDIDEGLNNVIQESDLSDLYAIKDEASNVDEFVTRVKKEFPETAEKFKDEQLKNWYKEMQSVDSFSEYLPKYKAPISEAKKETDPSMKPPKKWWDKMQKTIKADKNTHTKEQVDAIVGSIWSKLPEKKKKQLREKEGKTYGKAPVKESVDIKQNVDTKIKAGIKVKIKPIDQINKLNFSKEYKQYLNQIAGKYVTIKRAFKSPENRGYGPLDSFIIDGIGYYNGNFGFSVSIIDKILSESEHQSHDRALIAMNKF